MGFVSFMASSAGRVLRVLAGLALFTLAAVYGGVWWIAGAVGVVFIAVGFLDVCLVAPLIGQPLSGKGVRGD